MDVKELKNDASRHVGTCMVVNVILLCVARVVMKYLAGDYTIGVALPLVTAFLYAVIESLVVTALWSRTVVKALESAGSSPTLLATRLSQYSVYVSAFRLLAVLAILLVSYLAVGRAAFTPYFIYMVLFYFAMLVTHTLFFSRETKKIYE